MHLEDFPNRITVELTNNCNILCTFCNRNKICMDTGFMKKELFFKIIDETSEHLPVKLVPFFRGEPLMHPDIIECLAYAKNKGVGPIQIASNALLLDEKMQNELLECGVDYISFSLDTTDEELYKKSRLHGDLSISTENVISFSSKCKERKRKGLFAPTTQVSTINITEYMVTQENFIAFWKEHVDVVRVYEQHDEMGRLVDENLRRKLDIFDARRPCRKVFTDMIIYWDGKLALCNYDWDESRNFGDINEESIYEAWHSEAYDLIRQKHSNGKFDEEICKECHHWKIDYMDNGYLGRSYVNNEMEIRTTKI